MPSISVIIVTYNSKETIEACIRSVLTTIEPDDHVLVVDNASQDGTASLLMLLRTEDPRISVHLNPTNVFYTAACNQGIESTTGEYCLLLNPDTILFPGWRERMLRCLDRPSVGAVGPLTNYVTGRQYIEFHLPPVTRTLSYQEIFEIVSVFNSSTVEIAKLLVGFCVIVPRTVFQRYGLLHPTIIMGGDDLEFSWRLRTMGLELVIARDVFVYHKGGESFKGVAKAATDTYEDQSTRAICALLEEHYGTGNIPSSAELWGTLLFQPALDKHFPT